MAERAKLRAQAAGAQRRRGGATRLSLRANTQQQHLCSGRARRGGLRVAACGGAPRRLALARRLGKKAAWLLGMAVGFVSYGLTLPFLHPAFFPNSESVRLVYALTTAGCAWRALQHGRYTGRSHDAAEPIGASPPLQRTVPNVHRSLSSLGSLLIRHAHAPNLAGLGTASSTTASDSL